MADTTQDHEDNRICQLSIFLPNRLGALLSVLRSLEGRDIVMRAVSIVESADHSVARIIVDQPTLAASTLRHGGYSFVETELLGVAIPEEDGVQRLLKAVLMAELNLHYMYSLIMPRGGHALLAVHVEDPTSAARVLVERGFHLVDQSDLR